MFGLAEPPVFGGESVFHNIRTSHPGPDVELLQARKGPQSTGGQDRGPGRRAGAEQSRAGQRARGLCAPAGQLGEALVREAEGGGKGGARRLERVE